MTIAGVGLLGGSLGMALRERGLAQEVWGLVRRPAAAERCRKAGAVDCATLSVAEAAAGSDLVVLATPILQMPDLLASMLPHLGAGTLVTDVGSVKGCLVRDLEPLAARAGAAYVGSHPMAGGEKMGVDHARADLFEGSVCAITPGPSSRQEDVEQIAGLWRRVGSHPLLLPPETHDRIVSRTSHLPHVLAAQLVHQVLGQASPEQASLCGNGFRDTTRIASGSPEMWRDIVLANQAQLLPALEEFLEGLKRFQAALQQGDAEGVERFFHASKRWRDGWKQTGRSPE